MTRLALVTCNECGRQASDRARQRPHCGAPGAVPTRAVAAAALAGLLVVALMVGLLFARGGGGGGDDAAMIGGWGIGIAAVVSGLARVLLVARFRGGSR